MGSSITRTAALKLVFCSPISIQRGLQRGVLNTNALTKQGQSWLPGSQACCRTPYMWRHRRQACRTGRCRNQWGKPTRWSLQLVVRPAVAPAVPRPPPRWPWVSSRGAAYHGLVVHPLAIGSESGAGGGPFRGSCHDGRHGGPFCPCAEGKRGGVKGERQLAARGGRKAAAVAVPGRKRCGTGGEM